MITLDRLNRKEAIRYLGGAGISLNYRMDVLMLSLIHISEPTRP